MDIKQIRKEYEEYLNLREVKEEQDVPPEAVEKKDTEEQ